MLQIISGKFFKSEDRFHSDCKGVLYSNANYLLKFDAEHIHIEPIGSDNTATTYVICYDNQLEKPEKPAGAIVKVGDHEIIRQVKLICSFSANAIFDEEKQTVARICRDKDINIPMSYLSSNMLNTRNLSQIDIENCKRLFKDIIGLKREDYLSVMNCLTAYNAAILLLDQDISLAYSMLVYCIESLSQKYDFYTPEWEDYDQNKRVALDKIFISFDVDVANNIRSILIKDEHLKLTRRFIDFARKNLSDSFFEYEDEIPRPILPDDLERALINAYNIRSRYAHMLQPIMKQLTISSISKTGYVFEYNHDIFFTLNGLLKITKEIIHNFIIKQEKVEKESIDWYDQIPDKFTLKVAPQYWIWKPRTKYAMNQFTGFLELIIKKDAIPNMKDALNAWTDCFSALSDEDKHNSLALLLVYNILVERNDNWEKFIDTHKTILEECYITNLVLMMVLCPISKEKPYRDWKLEEIVCCIADYNKKKSCSTKIRFPSLIETLLYLSIANYALEEGDVDCFYALAKKALHNACGNPELQADIKNSISEKRAFNISKWQERTFPYLYRDEQEQ